MNTPPMVSTPDTKESTSPGVISPYMTAREAAAYARISYDHFRTLQAKRRTPAKRLGRRVLYRTADLDRWIDEQTRRA